MLLFFGFYIVCLVLFSNQFIYSYSLVSFVLNFEYVQMVKHNNYNNDILVKEFGLQVRPELTPIEARVLPPPMVNFWPSCRHISFFHDLIFAVFLNCQLKYHETGRQTVIEPRVGQWNMIDKVHFLCSKRV